MPELPEVENFRRLLLNLVSHDGSDTIMINCPSENPPRSFLTASQIETLRGSYYVKDVLRKGKLICMLLECAEKQVGNQVNVYLFLHMGMTGRISTPTYVPMLESLNDISYPPSHTHLTFKTRTAEACFSDPRKFGSVTLETSLSPFDDLAPDAQTDFDAEKLAGQSTGIKSLLLNQKKVISGVGNWVADEILYQSELHPEQGYLTLAQATILKEKLHLILNTAIACLDNRVDFPSDWIFHLRWGKRSANNGIKVKDSCGRSIVFLKAAGRTSAIAPSIQIKRSQNPKSKTGKKRDSPGASPTMEESLIKKKVKK